MNCYESLEALLASQLIPLNKSPGVRPIGIGEVLRRIIGKAVMSVVKKDVVQAAGSLQVCAGQVAGVETAIHSMVDLFETDDSAAVLQIVDSNAFNSLNRNVFLHNIEVICPEISNFVINCYTSPSRLFVRGKGELISKEGTTQGDPIAMGLYALGITPLMTAVTLPPVTINHPSKSPFQHVAFADDFTACGKLASLKQWFDEICRLGPYIGYYVNPTKTWLIVKDHELEEATRIFAGTGIKITSEGRRHLGGVIGTNENKMKYIDEKIDVWCREIEVLSTIAATEPHAAFAGFIFGLKHRYTYFMRTIPNISQNLKRLENSIRNCFIKSLFNGYECNNLERELFELPANYGGLGIINPSKISDREYHNSRILTQEGSELIKNQQLIYNVNPNKLKEVKNSIKCEKSKQHEDTLMKIKQTLENDKYRLKLLESSIEPTAYNWLTTIPLVDHDFYLDKTAFWDSIRIRYNIPLKYLPSRCICGQIFNLEHALSCKKGGFITLRHNDLRDFTAEQLSEVCHDVRLEPQLKPLTGEVYHYATSNTTEEARVDVSARGFWVRGQLAFSDIRVFNPLAKCYNAKNLKSIFATHEKEKKRSYNQRIIETENGSFTPLVFACTGGMSRECGKFYSRLADLIATKKNLHKSTVMGWLRAKLSFNLLRSVNICIRGSRARNVNEMKQNTADISNDIEFAYNISINEK